MFYLQGVLRATEGSTEISPRLRTCHDLDRLDPIPVVMVGCAEGVSVPQIQLSSKPVLYP